MKDEECAARVSEALERVPNVLSVHMRLDKSWAEVFQDRNCPASEEKLRKTVEELGYVVKGID